MGSIGNHFRSKAVINNVLPSLTGPKVIDIGAGSCHIAKMLASKFKLDVTAVDVVDHNITDFALNIYDGKKLPYADKSFDVGLLIFVLHHAPDASKLIEESSRVSKRLIIVEDLPGNRIEIAVWKRLDYLFNHAQHSDIDVAHKTMSISEWKDLFNKKGLKVIKIKKFRSLFTTGLTYPHVVFVLEPKN